MSNQDKSTLQNLLSVHYWADGLLSFKMTRPDDYVFVPGQYSRLGLPSANGQMAWRAYSVVSAPEQDFLEYYGVLVPSGLFTSALAKLQPGDQIGLDKQVFGFMITGRFTDGESLWMIATGTGLGPYISILRDPKVWDRFANVVVVHGARQLDELSYDDELRAMQLRSGGRLRLVQAVTREAPDVPLPPGVLRGRATSLLTDGSLERAAGLALTSDSARVMLCGNPDMIEEMRGLLHERGMRPVRRAAPGQFITENYW